MLEKSVQKNKYTLWTRDFTIITIGSVISMLGSALSGFAMSLLVLDYTKSTFLFALYNVLYMLPHAVAPALSGPFLDHFSRKRTIYTLDFISAGVYAMVAVVLSRGWFSFAVLAAVAVVIGTIDSVYRVAYESFYPLLITEGNFSKAYSIASTLETLTMVMLPISALIYNRFGIVPLFIVDAVSYFIAAIFETHIATQERYAEKRKQKVEQNRSFYFWQDLKEGIQYLWSEKGLLAVALYFTVSAFSSGVTNAVSLPYFKDTFTNGEYFFMLVWGMSAVGRAIGGGLHYKKKLPGKKKYAIALTVYITISVLEGVYLYCAIPVMMAMCFVTGILGVTSYTIRISATQQYVPDEKRGRFNGAFGTLTTIGSASGQLAAGVAAEFLPIRGIVSATMGICVVAALICIGGHYRHIAPIYNIED